ncbi:MAG: hypothetical protein DRP42_00900 [Tenericutes bacterium]|nr:MAG: hypothetical protein DRP42_00900 [Mycoplasmatota bacterium]
MKKIEIGPHVSFKSPNYLIGSINTLVKYKATAGGIFVGSPRSKQRKPIIMSQVKKAHETAKQEGFNLDNIIVHAPYIANIANGKRFDRTVFLRDVKRTNKLGLKYFNVHAGSNENLEMGIANVSNAINYIIENSDDVVILIETSVKKGNNIGSDFKEIKSIIKNVDNKSRVGVCMDTCHI